MAVSSRRPIGAPHFSPPPSSSSASIAATASTAPPAVLGEAETSLLNEATTSLLHASLDIHLPQQLPSTGSRSVARPRSTSRTLQWSRGSIEDFRGIAAEVGTAHGTTTHGSHNDGAMRNTAFGGSEILSSGVTHPFAHTTGLLRRTHSADLLERDAGPPSDDEFSSEDEVFRPRPPSIASTSSQRSSRIGVLLEDCSERENHAFATDVRITGFHPVGAQNAGGFVVFEIEINTPQGTLIKLNKRYSAFVVLRSDLVRAFPHFKAWIPRLPPKNSLAKYRPSFLERRRAQLAYWLSTVLLHPETGSCALVRNWVLS